MKYISCGSVYRVRVSQSEVYHFNSRWPGSRIPEKTIIFEFDGINDDLLDIYPELVDCGEELLALSQDAQEFGKKFR